MNRECGDADQETNLSTGIDPDCTADAARLRVDADAGVEMPASLGGLLLDP